jgi:predicted acyltransferase
VFDGAIPGITWVDLVFPFFLFAMGAAIPLALGRRVDGAEPLPKLVSGLLERGLLLGAFAFVSQHLRPYTWTENPSGLFSLAGFLITVLMFLRWPPAAPKWLRWSLTGAAWVAALWLMNRHTYSDGTGFANSRMDIIILVLANVAVSGGLLWLLTRSSPLARMTVMAGVAAIFLGSGEKGSLANLLFNWDPVRPFLQGDWQSRFPLMFDTGFHKYLLIVLPGTFAGEALRNGANGDASWQRWRLALLLPLGLAMSVAACIGMFTRQVIPYSCGLVVAGLAAVFLTGKPMSRVETSVSRLTWIGLPLLVLGLLLEPIGGGIRKDSATISYFFVTSGLASFLLAGLAAWSDELKFKGFNGIGLVGANPLLAYVAITNLIPGLNILTMYGANIADKFPDPWIQMMLDGGMKTLLVAVVAGLGTRFRMFLRA